ncbi:MAG: phosphatidate cytidylyltransferase [Gammaproteobacteria bacterium]|nr:phosphatidate cytidylyltransferase [Gammaproteobacteria bacterium]
MLKTRLLTALILIPIFIFLVLKLSNIAFALLTAFFVLLGAYEWARFMGLQKKSQRFCYVFLIFLGMKFSLSVFIPYALIVTLVWWLVAFVMVVSYPKGHERWSQSLFLRGLMGVMVLIPAWIAINFIRLNENGPIILLYLCVLIWGADSGAYFAGRQWGKTKLAPAVSPGKTREGFYGALFTTILIAFIGMQWDIVAAPLWVVMALALATVLFSVLGDLFESMMKRNVGLKDSGNVFPGHGGLLDRIDSLTAAAPVFAYGYLLVLKFFH